MKWAPTFKVRFSTKLFVSHLLAVFLVSGSVGTFFYVRAMDNLMRSLRSRLQNSAAILSQNIDARALETIQSAGDVGEEAYLATLEKLRRMRRSNPDIAFLYVMRKQDDGVVFVVDSDETEAQALPGRVYDDVTPLLELGFHQASVDDELVEDEWGVFLSGYSPLLHGEGRYLVGIDMRADEVKNKLAELRLTGLASLFASILLALLFALYLARGLTRRIETLSTQCREIALGRFGARIEGRTFDEFDDLAGAFNRMSESLGDTRIELNRAIDDLRNTRDELEVRVAERTKELQGVIERMNVLRGLLPICSSCKKIRDDKGYWTQVEQFVAARSEARFTHGICPDCLVNLYGHLLPDKDITKPV
ncbi:MAG TPA: HAMP domain-containing protein [Kiritimatiellia bacterium]|nr:HAMP domain-containing protein [Kiritimatiellia bacterium]HMP00211.1 HAMP domain-containing protein [Kiritimatiellia bacterium]HMP96841.1 HAMP domain-containing protein [Kiritimatiellia bacterium]